ncbi:MAG: flippase activity-associated protein Agl23 [Planctomycetota bacterium]
MKPRLICLVLLVLVAGGALAFRLPRLGDRPMHADEAVQAARSRQLWEQGRYRYDPNEFHGPTLQYATLASLWTAAPGSFAETTEATYRIVPVLFGAGMILLLWFLADGLGKAAAVCAGVLVAVSPAMVFYSRYYIHETLLAFFTLAVISAGWRYLQSGKLAWCLAAGAFLGLMQATKETSVISHVAMGLALLLVAFWARLAGEAFAEDRPTRPGWHLALGLAAAILVAGVLLTSFFTNPRGPIDGVLAFLPWLSRAQGASPHVHPWYYYFHVLACWQEGNGPVWSEGLILGLAAVGFGAAFFPAGPLTRGASSPTHQKDRVGWLGQSEAVPQCRSTGASLGATAGLPSSDSRENLHSTAGQASSGTLFQPAASAPFVRWVGFYTVASAAAYSVIPYKTPWCLLNFLEGMILLAGVGAVALVRLTPTLPLKALTTLLLVGATGQLGWQSYRASFVLAADPGNPYVYAHTLPDAARLSGDVAELAKASPEGEEIVIEVIWHDAYYWPLPWYLRSAGHVEYWTRVPDDPGAPVIISSPELDAPLTERLDATHLMTGYYGVRPNVLAQLWVRMDLWEAHLRRLERL